MSGSVDLHLGDCLAILPTLAADSIDAVVTDPPYGLSFMGKDWDHGVPGEHFWREVLRVARPGAHLLAFGGTRTFHRLAVAIEDAGWEYRDTVMWVYSQGFPKSHDVSKAIERNKVAIASTVLADFILLGHEAVGSFALSSSKTGMFATAMGAWLDAIADTLNALMAVPKPSRTLEATLSRMRRARSSK
jgi:site-specific DNA-methyltransferase (adenine-specific)